ncbi:glycine oxidase maturase GoxB [Hyalangium rubrum]|uniref:Glycine oxidase maturase GoxB n=1 Tax=Hyalangium rubrum TaxID=3103134 RepID=A0ABU5GX04_9BACT|nr:glycine oxidase maturase GoxB [Hyalangium sp. s54d21]MDY7225723.1 glycine oxidase maturase GoxB [Hyalangium sp. s54d21]
MPIIVPTRVDIAIIGAGIAGAAAALTLAGRGRSVIMVAPASKESPRTGESLSPAAHGLLRDLGLTEAFQAGPHRPSHATYAAWGMALLAQRNSIIHTEGPGHVIDRRAFERMLGEAVSAQGMETVPDTLADATRAGDGWSLTLSGGARVEAGFVLDCSGRAAVFARRVARRRRADRLVAAYDFVTQHDETVEPTPATLIEGVAGGWWYATLLPDRRLSLAFFTDPDLMPREVTREAGAWRTLAAETHFIQRWLDSAGYAIREPARLTSAGTAWLDPATGPGWAAAGDAAAAFDPLSSHGLTSALWGGRQAALAALASLGGDPGPLRRYAATLESAVRNFVVQRQAVYSQERRFRGQLFWKRRAAPP